MKKKIQVVLGFAIAMIALCLMTSCEKIDDTNPRGGIQGIVTDLQTNEPIQGVNISLSPTGLSAVTGSDGRYEFSNLEAGQYTVQAMKNGYESNTKNILISGNTIASGDMMLRPAQVGFHLNVEYLDFGTSFNTLNFKIINESSSLSMSWEIQESLNWLETSPSTGNLQGGQEVTVFVNIDRSLIAQNTQANIIIRSDDQTLVLPVSVRIN
ncbi:MAG: carboxypeptidase-like regulatory domain-containing protein [Bacteroidales bacterium]|nr:carboxypeptidase-like regulatory domain-containing protein [Bacteroidales bacterium]